MIAIVVDIRPTDLMIEKMWKQNDDGFGCAWREGNEVVWEKGIMKLEEVKELMAKLPMPYIAHFRTKSDGMEVCPQLTHPFPISSKTDLRLSGRTKGHVLFHNGTWKEWKNYTLQASRDCAIPLPRGKQWSDSRAMAYLSSDAIHGLGFLDFIDEKGIAFGPKPKTEADGEGYEIYIGKTGWKEVTITPGQPGTIWCSNDYFYTRQGQKGNIYDHDYGYGHTIAPTCKGDKCYKIINLDASGYCPDCKAKQLGPVLADAKGTKTDSTTAGAGGTQQVTPFRKGAGNLGLAGQRLGLTHPVMSVVEAEKLFGLGQLSKKQLKRVKKFHGQSGQPKAKKRKKRSWKINL